MSIVKDQQLYDECKRIVKTWECQFMKNSGRPPSKLDIKEADKHVRDAYGTYFRLKTAALEESLMDILDDDIDDHRNSTQSESGALDKCEEPVSPSDERNSPIPCESPVKENAEDVWGDHLNKKPVTKATTALSVKTEDMNSSFTQKLFANSKFMKRNPRKSLLNTSAKLDTSLNNSSVNTSTLPSTVPSAGSTSKSEEPKEDSLTEFSTTLHISSDVRQVAARSVNVFSDILSNSVNMPARKVDVGWLKRVAVNTGTEFNECDIIDSLESELRKPVESDSTIVKAVPVANGVTQNYASDGDDVISESDNEENATVYQVSKRIKLSPAVGSSSKISSLNSDNVTSSQNESSAVTVPEIPKIVTNNAECKKDVKEPGNILESTTNGQEINETQQSEDEQVKRTTRKGRRKVLDSGDDSDYEQPKQAAKKRKRKPEAKTSLGKPKRKSKSPGHSKTTARRRRKDVPKVPAEEDGKDTEEYEIEYSLKPPPPTVPRFQGLPLDVNSSDPGTPPPTPRIESQESLKKQAAKDKLLRKIASGSLNENYLRIDIKKKVFVRGKKHMNFSKYKRQQWKSKKKALYGPDMDMGGCDGGQVACFKCGKTGHFARQCKNQDAARLLPLDAVEEDECDLPSLEQAATMARASALAVRIPNLLGEPSKPVAAETKDSASGEEENVYEFQEDEELESFMLNTEHFDAQAGRQRKWTDLLDEKAVKPLYSLTADGTLPDTPPEVFAALHQFGHSAFRAGQEQAVMRILSGQSTLVTLSTGSGKSLCYQLPAYLYAAHRKCISLVISPLVSLMEDQVSGIAAFLKAACLHTGQTAVQREKILKLVAAGELNVLLVSPEAVTAGEKRSGFGSLLRKLPPIAFACIDEAHCVSQWSHNFRPSYLVICRVLRERLGIRTVLGLTATSTHATSTSIVDHLQIPDGHKGVISDIPLPDNLCLCVSSDAQRDAALRCLLLAEPYAGFDAIIVYCTRREECERIAGYLRASIRPLAGQQAPTLKKYKSLSAVAEPYHAGLPASKRRTVQNAFMGGFLRIVVATVAFGMGINKANIRAVVHYNMPSNFESYVQEVGRAGRDGLPAQCHLFLNAEGHDQNELRRHIYANAMDRHAIRKLLQKIFVPCGCKRTCPRHEVAFSIEDTVKLLDVPEQNIATLLCYLELHERKFLELLTPVYTTCKVIAYGSGQRIKRAALDCPPLAMALALQQKQGAEFKKNVFEFPVVEVAAAMGWDSGIVKSKLKNLEWTAENNMPKRSTLSVEFSNLGFHMRSPGNLTPAELDEALDSLYAKKQEQELTSLQQLQVVYSTLTQVAERGFQQCLQEAYGVKSGELKARIREYFSCEHPLKGVEIVSNVPGNVGQIVSDVRNLLAMYRDNSFTGRAVARIFHGIQSPNYPAVMWGRCKFWRAHLHSDFNQVCQIATAEILKLR